MIYRYSHEYGLSILQICIYKLHNMNLHQSSTTWDNTNSTFAFKKHSFFSHLRNYVQRLKRITLSVESNREETWTKWYCDEDKEDALKRTEVETIYLKSQITCTSNLWDASWCLFAPKTTTLLLGRVCVSLCVHVNMYT